MQAKRKLVAASFVAVALVGVLAAAKNGEERGSGSRMAEAAKEFLAKLAATNLRLAYV